MRTDTRTARPPATTRLPLPETAVGHSCGLLLCISSLGMVAAGMIELAAGGDDVGALLGSGIVLALPGLVLWRRTRLPARLARASIFSVVLTSWVTLSLAATVPYLATGTVGSFWDALFEATAGFTTTSATILRPIEGLGAGILFWRALTQWLGGMGVIVLAVAVLPYLGIGGLGLLRAEVPGPSSERLVPRVRETAKRLWILYVVFTIAVASAYALAGMGPHDAVAHAFTTVSTGGYSSYDDSMAHFASSTIEWIAIGAMFLAGGNFALYWRAIRGKPLVIVRSPEALGYAAIVTTFAGAAVAWNVAGEGWSHDVVRGSVFSVVSLSSTTGFTTVDYTTWVSAVQLLLLFAMVVGGMTGSVAGGFKVFRLLAVLSYGRRQTFLQLHPRIVRTVRMRHQVIPDEIVARVVGFFGLFMALGALGTFVVAAFGGDMITSISAAAASLGNTGPGLGEIGPSGHFLNLATPARLTLAALMLAGRLEVFPVLLGAIPLFRLVADRLPARVSQVFLRLFRG